MNKLDISLRIALSGKVKEEDNLTREDGNLEEIIPVSEKEESSINLKQRNSI